VIAAIVKSFLFGVILTWRGSPFGTYRLDFAVVVALVVCVGTESDKEMFGHCNISLPAVSGAAALAQWRTGYR
jgi:hypothetical protein